MASNFFITGRQLWLSDPDGGNARLFAVPSKFFNASLPFASNGKIFFQGYPANATDNDFYGEPFVTDGTAAGTLLLKDIMPGTTGSDAHFVATLGSQTLFWADMLGSNPSRALYATDGTAAGTIQLASGFFRGGTPPGNFSIADGRAVFTVQSNASGRPQQVWSTDGTAAGTQRLVGPAGAALTPAGSTLAFGGAVVFTASASATGTELYITDGTASGSRLVKDIVAGSGSSNPQNLTLSGDKLYFTQAGQLWASDGTTAGTNKLAFGPPVETPYFPSAQSLRVAGDRLFFTASNNDSTGRELFVLEATAVYPRKVKEIGPGFNDANISQLTVLGDKVVFVADDGVHGRELWISDGTAAGTLMIDIYPELLSETTAPGGPEQLTASNGLVFFTAANAEAGRELWVTDGTAAGTRLVRDIAAGSGDSSVAGLTAEAGGVLFSAYDPERGTEAWFSDGSAAGTRMMADATPGRTMGFSSVNYAGSIYTNSMVGVGGRLVFTVSDAATGVELWGSDPADAVGAHLLRDVFAGRGDGFGAFSRGDLSSGSNYTLAGDKLFFVGADPVHGNELWVTDGTSAGSHLVIDINPGIGDAGIVYLRSMGGKAYFNARYNAQKTELWVSDGTAEGTHTVLDPTAPGGSYFGTSPQALVAVGSKLFFLGRNNDTSLLGLAVTDGTAAGTTFLGAAGMVGAGRYLVFGDKLVFASTPAATGTELWISDGTVAGSMALAEIYPGSQGSDPFGMTAAGGRFYFTANDPVHGKEVWSSDGTPGGTSLLKDIYTGANGSNPFNYTASGGKVYFGADPGPFLETALWVTDGTAAGTVNVKIPGSYNKVTGAFTAFEDKLLFDTTNYDGVGLFITDGSDANTKPFFYTPTPRDNSQLRGGAAVLGVIDHRALILAAGHGATYFVGLYSVDVNGGEVLLKGTGGETLTPGQKVYGVIDGRLVFDGVTESGGEQLWSTDGTQAGTVRVTNYSRPNSSTPTDFGSTLVASASPPVVSGLSALAIGDHDAVAPFAAVLVSDADSASLTVSLSLDDPAVGAFTPASLAAAGFTGLSFTGSPAQVQAALRALVFLPDPFHTAAGEVRGVVLAVSVSDGANSVRNTAAVLSVTGSGDAPIALVLDAGSDTGTSSSDRITSDATPSFSGRADAGSTVRLYDDLAADGSAALASVAADASGRFTLTAPAQADGPHRYRVEAQEGSLLLPGLDRVELTLDTVAPSAPRDLGLSPASRIDIPGQAPVLRGAAPVLTGQTEPGATVAIYDGAVLIGTGTADSSGTFSVTGAALSAGLHTLSAGSTDVAGNVGARSAPIYVPVFAQALAGDEDPNALTGGAGGDLLAGFGGADVLIGRGGLDVLFGGDGADSFRFDSSAESPFATPDYIGDFVSGVDLIDLRSASGIGVAIAYVGSETFVGFDPSPGGRGQPAAGTPRGLVAVEGWVEASDLLLGGAVVGLSLFGSEAADRLTGLSTPDALYGGAGTDLLIGAGGADSLTGGSGADVFRELTLSDSAPGAGDGVLDFERGQDVIDISAVAGAYVNLAFDDAGGTGVFYAPQAGGTAGGGLYAVGVRLSPSDVQAASGSTFVLSAAPGGSTLVGSGAFDILIGGGGADVLVGGGGGDALSGGAGADVFRYDAVTDSTPASFDVISDFASGSDKIDLTRVAGGVVNVVRTGADSYVFYAPTAGGAGGAIKLVGSVVADSDILAEAGTVFLDSAGFAAAAAELEADLPVWIASARWGSAMHCSLF